MREREGAREKRKKEKRIMCLISSVFSVSKQHRGAGSMTGLLQRTAYGRGERGREGERERERE